MNMFYGNYKLPIDDLESILLIERLCAHVVGQTRDQLSGISLSTLDETKHLVEKGFVLLGNVDKTTLIGAGYLDGAGNRVWLYMNEGEVQLFIDGMGVVVEGLGLKYNPEQRSVFSPFNNLTLTTL